MMEGPCADSEEKHEPVSDINTVGVNSLKAFDPKRPIREADIASFATHPAQAYRRIAAGDSTDGRDVPP